MLPRTLALALIALALSPTFCIAQDLSRNGNLDNREGGEEFKLEREKFYRDMHRAEPGLNWKAIDEETRRMKSDRILQQKRMMSKGPKAQSQLESFPNGLSGVWSERGSGNVAGRVHSADLDIATNTLYAASSYGNIWRRQLPQPDWQCLNDDRRFNDVRLLRVLPGARTRIIALVNGPAALYYSDNAGGTWEKATGLDAINAWGGFRRGVITKNRVIYALGYEWDWAVNQAVAVLYVSTDLGTSFARLMAFGSEAKLEQMDIWASRNENTPLYLAKADSIFTLKNGKLQLYSTAPIDAKLSETTNLMLQGRMDGQETRLRLLAYQNGHTDVHRVGTESRLWEPGGSIESGAFNVNSFAISQEQPGYMYFAGMETWRSTDDGNTWSKFSNWWDYYNDSEARLHADVPAIEIIDHPAGGEQVFISTDGGLFVSQDHGESVLNLMLDGIGTSQYYSTYSTEKHNVIFAGSQDQGFQQGIEETTGVLPFVQTYSGDYGHVGSSDHGESVWTDYPGFVMLYPDAVNTSEKYTWNFIGKNQLWMPPVVVDPEQPLVAYVANGDGVSSGCYIWKLSYSGADVVEGEQQPFDFAEGEGKRTITAFAISPLDSRYWYVLTDDGIFFSSIDGGRTYIKAQSFSGPNGHYFYGASVLPSKIKLGTVYIAGSGYSNDAAYMTTDNGSTFRSISTGLPPTLVFDIATDSSEQRLFAATEVGPYAYDFKLGEWLDIQGMTAPDHVYWSVEYLPGKKVARFGTHGRGIWDFTLAKEAAVASSPKTTTAIRLHASPTVVTSSTKIGIELAEPTDVSIRIFDVTGRLVSELHNGPLAASEHTFSWDVSQAFLPNGFYTCIATGGGNTSVVKLQVQR